MTKASKDVYKRQDFAPTDYNEQGKGVPYMTGASCIVEGPVSYTHLDVYKRQFYCYIDDFYSGNDEDIKLGALFKEMERYIDQTVRPVSYTHLTADADVRSSSAVRTLRSTHRI